MAFMSVLSASAQRMPSAVKSVLALAACLACAHAAATASAAPGPASAAQHAAFDAWYASAEQGPAPTARTVQATGAGTGLVAQVIGPARRGARSLCVAHRRDFVFDDAWREAGQGVQLAWLEKAGCTARERAVASAHPMPETDLLELLERSAGLLASARLLFAGNTECARLRAYPFALKTIGVSAPVKGGETMASLGFSAVQGTATVWVRRSGLEYTAWNVACTRA